MKKNIICAFALLALTFTACNKELETPIVEQNTGGTPITIRASLDIPELEAETKTTYTGAGNRTFGWKNGDQIELQTVSTADGITLGSTVLTCSADGTSVEFTGVIPDGYRIGDYAFYPYGTGNSSYSSDLRQQDDGTLRLWGSMTPDLDNPMGSIPLIGKNAGDGSFTFKTATGILKVELKGIPNDVSFIRLDLPDNNTYALNGRFTYGDDCIIYASNVSGTKWGNKYIYYTPVSHGETRTFYFAIPVGTIPAGLTLSVESSSKGQVVIGTTTAALEVKKNKVMYLGSKNVNWLAKSDVIGAYKMYVTNGSYGSSHNSAYGGLVITDTDDPAKGDLILTQFAGIAGKQYATFDGCNITFNKEDLFASNPFDDAATNDMIALDAFKGGVINPVFRATSAGNLALDSDVEIGFRSTTAAVWASEKGGGWPWRLGFKTMTAERWPANQIQLSPEMVTLGIDAGKYDGTAHYDGKGKLALIDGNSDTFWHSPYYDRSTTDTKYGDTYYSCADLDGTYGAYIDIDLGSGNTISGDLTVKFRIRNAGGGWPKRVRVYGSVDKTAWTDVGHTDNAISGTANGAWMKNPIACTVSEPSRYLRIAIETSYNSGDKDMCDNTSTNYTHMALLELYGTVTSGSSVESSNDNYIDGGEVAW